MFPVDLENMNEPIRARNPGCSKFDAAQGQGDDTNAFLGTSEAPRSHGTRYISSSGTTAAVQQHERFPQ